MTDGLLSTRPPSVVPEAVVDALVETAWAFPGLRVSYARMSGPRSVRHLASAGATGLPDFTGQGLDLSGADDLLEAFQTADQAIGIEDVTVDGRTRPIAKALVAQGTRSYLIWPVRQPRDPFPMGWIALDSDRPRTWGAKESDALEHLDPLILMALDHAVLSEALSTAKSSIREFERRLGGLHGFAGSVLQHADILLGSLGKLVESNVGSDVAASASALRSQLGRVVSELEPLQLGSRPTPLPVDLNQIITDAVPAFAVLVGEGAQLQTRLSPDPLVIDAHRPGVERALFHLLAHAAAADSAGASIVLETKRVDDVAELRVSGDGLGFDEALVQIGDGSTLTNADRVDLALWRARCELLLHAASLEVNPSKGLQLRFPLIA